MRDLTWVRGAALCLAWALLAAAAAELRAQDVDPADYDHLLEPRIVERADERMLEVRAVGDPDETGIAAFEFLFELYFLSGAASGFEFPVPRARWPERIDRIPRSEWVARYALPLPETVDALPSHTPREGMTASVTTWEYGTVAEILHVGPYEAELPTIERLILFALSEGYEPVGGHEEEYVIGPTMDGPGNPDEYRTILRYRVRDSTNAEEPTG